MRFAFTDDQLLFRDTVRDFFQKECPPDAVRASWPVSYTHLRAHETALDLLDAEAEVESRWLDGYTFSLSGPIYAGTNEIQRNIVAERLLGLPKA